MDNKIAVAMAALMVAAVPMVMADDVSYTATVVASNIVVTDINTAFGDLLAGTTTELSPSLNLTNSGDAAADVDVKFINETGGIYGLVSATDVIGAGNFSIGTDGNEIALNNDGTDKALGANNQVPGSGSIDYDVIFTVPSGQAGGVYSGTVQLTFTTVV